MTEREKMINEMMYDAGDSELVKLRQQSRELCDKVNNSPDGNDKTGLIKNLFGGIGKKIYITPNFKCDYGKNIYVGENFYVNFNCVILDVAEVHIGDNCLIAPNVGIYTATHPIDREERKSGKEYGKKIIIGDDCWLGGSVVICPGVTLGDNVIVGAGSVVTKSFGDNVVIAGNPARVIREIG